MRWFPPDSRVGGGVLAEDPKAVTALADAAWTLADRLSCPTVELRGGPWPGPEWDADSSIYLGFARDLAADDEAELAAVPRKQRAEVRKALGFDLQVSTGCHAEDAAAHYAVYAESVRNLGTPVFPREVVFRGFAGVWQIRGRAYGPASGSASVERIEPLLERDRLSLLGWRHRRRARAARQRRACISR